MLDVFGNRIQSTVTGFGMAGRTASATYDALGRFVVETTNDLNQVTQKVNDWDAFSNALEVENIDGVLTFAAADFMGRPFISYTETGGFGKTTHSTSTSSCPSGTAIKSTTIGAGVPEQIQCQDVLGRTIRTATDGFGGTLIYVDQYFDSSGRVERVSEPYYAGGTLYWNETAYNVIGWIDSVLAADDNHMTFDYDGAATNSCTAAGPRVKTTTNGLGQVQVEVSNALGETVDVYDDSCGQVSYSYDATGNLRQVTGADGETVTMSYDLAGRKTSMNDPDKGNWQYAYNPLGEMTRQLDAQSQAIDFEYDSLGRVTNRRELSNVSSLTDTIYTTVNRETTTFQNSTSAVVMGKGQPTSIVYRIGQSGTVLHQRDYIYDSFGRLDTASTTVEGTQFAEQTTYDQYGRVFQQFDASGDFRGLRSHYNAQGYLWKLQEAREGTAGTVYQQVISMDQRGNATQVKLGNDVDVFANYEAASGRLLKLSAYDALGVELQNVDYLFDVLGNLKERHDLSVATNLKETFNYDDLNRLLNVNLSVNGAAANQTLALSYSAAGNILSKSDVGTYLYNGAQPHAVSSAGGVSYSYDANGNQISGDGRTITYTVFDKADSITRGANEAIFAYGIGNSRYQREDKQGGITQKTTTYLGSVERIDEGGSIRFKRYLGGVAVATFYPSTSAQSIDYLLKDHIGSIHTVLNESAQITNTMHFGAFGQRQDTNWQTPLSSGQYALLNDITTRGFTGHEQVDDVGIIHMNGRIYDAKLGRFLQADPIVQAPKNSQSLNRYSYVLNNPLSYTDPSGYFFKELFKFVWAVAILAGNLENPAAWAAVLETGKDLFNSIGSQQIVLPPGITVGSLSSQIAVPNSSPSGSTAQQITDAFTDVTTATIGGTYSDATGGKFTNGGDSNAFAFTIVIGEIGSTISLPGGGFSGILKGLGKLVFPIARTVTGVVGGILYPTSTGGCGSNGCLDELPLPPLAYPGSSLDVNQGATIMNSESLGRNPSQDKKLTKGDIDKLKGNDINPEALKGRKHTGRRDLFKDRKGNIYVKPKDGSGPGDPTGININDLKI